MSADGATGTSILTSGLPPAPPPEAPPAPGSAAEAVKTVQDGPPEWAPAKFWDAEKKEMRYEDLGRGYQNLEKLLGREKVPVPVNDDDKEGWERWYAATGRPESSDKYEFKRPDKMPEGLDYDEDLEKEFRDWAHVNGLNKKQANSFYEGFVKRQIDRTDAWHTHQKQMKAQVESDMRREYGAQYEGALAQAKAAMSKYADPDYIKYLEDSGQGNDPRAIRAWIKIGKEMGGTTKLKGAPAQEMVPADIDRAIAEFKSKNWDKMNDKTNPDRERLVGEYNKLFQMKFPTGAA